MNLQDKKSYEPGRTKIECPKSRYSITKVKGTSVTYKGKKVTHNREKSGGPQASPQKTSVPADREHHLDL